MSTVKTTSGTNGLLQSEPLLFERSVEGRTGWRPATSGVPLADDLPEDLLRQAPMRLPELSEPEVVRHYTRLSQWNYSIDTGLYPLGSCTMKYNPRVAEDLAALDGFAQLHPWQPVETLQGALHVMAFVEDSLKALTGLHAVTLQPAAGAHGELLGLLLIRACQESRGDPRSKILVPASAHGTNPASASMAGYQAVEVPAGPDGILEVDTVARLMDDQVAGLMVTHPNTLGLYERNLSSICKVVHEAGGLVYGDGANLNALMGIVRPGDLGMDVMHFNLHKTFSTPHGGGGPGAGPVAVTQELEPFLPVPVIHRGDPLTLEWDRPNSVGRVRSFYGNFGVVLRAASYIMEMGAQGLTHASRMAILNANYLRVRLSKAFEVAFPQPCMHEVILTDRLQRAHGVQTIDIAKRLMDYGFHPPTVYFPLVVPHAMMIEPTETESLDELDAFADALIQVAREAGQQPDTLKSAPSRPSLGRLDEVGAARFPDLRYDFDSTQ